MIKLAVFLCLGFWVGIMVASIVMAHKDSET